MISQRSGSISTAESAEPAFAALELNIARPAAAVAPIRLSVTRTLVGRRQENGRRIGKSLGLSRDLIEREGGLQAGYGNVFFRGVVRETAKEALFLPQGDRQRRVRPSREVR